MAAKEKAMKKERPAATKESNGTHETKEPTKDGDQTTAAADTVNAKAETK